MVSPKNPIPPLGSPQPPPDHAHVQKKHDKLESEYGSVSAKPITFLGMHFTAEEASKLWDAIIQQVNSQIRKDEQRALKALKKLKKESTEDN